MTFKHPPTPPAIPVTAPLELPVRRVQHSISEYYADVPGARTIAEEQALADLLLALRERYGPAAAQEARERHSIVHRPPAWPGDSARVWVTADVTERDAA